MKEKSDKGIMLHNNFSPFNYQCINNDDIQNDIGEADDGDNEYVIMLSHFNVKS